MIKSEIRVAVGITMLFTGFVQLAQAENPNPQSKKQGIEVVNTFTTSGQIWSSATHSNGTIFVGSDDNCLWALDLETLGLKWRFITGGRVRSTPAVANGNVFFASDDGFLYSLATEDGALNWRFDLESTGIERGLPSPHPPYKYDYLTSSPAVEGDVVFVGSANGILYAIDASKGTKKWTFSTEERIRSSPILDDTAVYFGSWDHNVYALKKSNGDLIWRFDTGGVVQSTPALGDGRLYIGSRNPKVFALDAKTGKTVWESEHKDGSWVESSGVFKDGVLYVGSSDSLNLFAFDGETGDIKWKFRTGGWSWSTPSIYADSVLIGAISAFPYYFKGVTLERGLHSVDINTGESRWVLPTKTLPGFITGGVMAKPLVVNDRIVFGALDGRIIVIKVQQSND